MGLAPWSPSILPSLPAPAADAFQCLPEGAVLVTTDVSSLEGGGTLWPSLWPARQAWACGWTKSQAHNSSNWRELKTVVLALAYWQPLLQGKWVVVTVAVINKGYSSAAALNELAGDIRTGIGQKGLWLGMAPFGIHPNGFCLSVQKLKLLISSLPWGPGVVKTLKCGPHVCKDACLSVLLDFLRLQASGGGGAPSLCLKTLNLASCDLGEAVVTLFPLLPRSLEQIDLSGNRLRSEAMEALGSVLSFGWLPNLVSLNLSDNPLGPAGMWGLARGLSSSPQTLPLQCSPPADF
uniref:Uncharacterized protein n=1 Tax=Chromera velia CCMP2878 TaxID=1169474 RepID=A0A0G4F9E9_9ALVE|eukprot:Cvel_15759.t1-p1 / transcript=Cvel_15759.t1 / gene=Cvel_15759 / organism=Chromera_velia_CCMP2878 / gene_product=hypothetical protein / transcript_product=hypothetical protein / location=Cvel_scaffold1180:31549-38676(-) / protein_length=292 / sequence_SO=supercontig / SO=protein_coding / is_pseudo=false